MYHERGALRETDLYSVIININLPFVFVWFHFYIFFVNGGFCGGISKGSMVAVALYGTMLL